MKQKILFVIPSLGSGGAERVMLTILNNLNRDKFDLHLCIIKTKGNYFNFLKNDVTVHLLDCNYFLFSLKKIYNCIKNVDPDIVFGFLSFVIVYLGLIKSIFLPNKIFIARETGLPSTRKKILTKNNNLFCSMAYNAMDAVICQCAYQKKELITYYNISSEKLTLIPNPTDCSTFTQYNLKPALTTKRINLVSIGALKKQKNYPSAINTINLCRNEDIHLHIYGEGPLREKLSQQIHDLNLQDKIFLHGFKQIIDERLVQYDAFLMTSSFEPCSNALLEAQAAGLPAIVYDCPGANAEIIQDGITGFLIELNNEDKLAQCLSEKKYLSIDRGLIHRHIKKTYLTETSIAQYESLLVSFAEKER